MIYLLEAAAACLRARRSTHDRRRATWPPLHPLQRVSAVEAKIHGAGVKTYVASVLHFVRDAGSKRLAG